MANRLFPPFKRSRATIQSLPPELILSIADLLEIPDLLAFYQLSRYTHEVLGRSIRTLIFKRGRSRHLLLTAIFLNNSQLVTDLLSSYSIPLYATYTGGLGPSYAVWPCRYPTLPNSNGQANATCCTPLAFAAQEGRAEIVKVLLEHGASVDMRSGTNRWTPLIMAACYGHKDVLEVLLDAGAEIDRNWPHTALREAVYNGQVEAVEFLLSKGASTRSFPFYPSTTTPNRCNYNKSKTWACRYAGYISCGSQGPCEYDLLYLAAEGENRYQNNKEERRRRRKIFLMLADTGLDADGAVGHVSQRYDGCQATKFYGAQVMKIIREARLEWIQRQREREAAKVRMEKKVRRQSQGWRKLFEKLERRRLIASGHGEARVVDEDEKPPKIDVKGGLRRRFSVFSVAAIGEK